MCKAVPRKQRDGCSGWKERGRYTDPPRPPTAPAPGVPHRTHRTIHPRAEFKN